MVFEALQNKERKRNTLVSKSFTFYYSILCFPFVISRLHSLLLLLCGNHGLPHGGGCGRGPSQQKRDTAPHTAHAGAGGLHTEADAIRQDGRRHPVGQTAAFGNGGKGEDAYRHGLCPEKIQEICIFQITNKIRMNKG